jgi:hypothetical protein
MQRLSISLFFITCFLSSYAQNVVPNCSFETYTTCPTSPAQVGNCSQWRPYTSASPDYFNACNTGNVGVPVNAFGNEAAAHGQAYVGFVDYIGNNYREYVATTITPLTVNITYEVSMSVSLADNSQTASNGLGIYFFQNAPYTLTTGGILPVTPQVSFASYGPLTNKTGWVRVSGTFVADSAYTNLVIGGFLQAPQIVTIPTNPTNYAYYYIDSVVVKPVTPIVINFSGTQACKGASVSVPYTIANNVFTAGNVFTLQLSNASGSFASPVNIGSVTSTTSGTINGIIPINTNNGTGYRLRIVSSTPSYTSDDNGTNIIIVGPNITASVNSPVCAGNSINLLATATSGSTFSWVGPSFTSTVQSPSITNATTANTGDYIVTATLLGCVEKDTVTVVVNPVPTITSINNNGPLCAGSNLNLTAQGSGSSYQWTGPSFSSSLQNPAINNVTIAAQGSYSVTTSLNGCTSSPMSTNIVINPMPIISFKSSNSPICGGGILTLFATANPAGVVYNWSGPANFSSQQQNPVIDPAGTQNAGNYIVSATLNGCTSKPDTVSVIVNIIAYLGAYASPNDTICEGDSIRFVTVPVNGGNNPVFQWYKNNVQISGATGLKYTTSALVTGDSFYCRMIANNSCNTPLTLYSDKIGVMIYPHKPAPTVSIASVPVNPLPGNAVIFTVNISNAGSNPQIQWLRNGQDVVGAISNTWSATNLNPYDKISVRVTSSEYCPDIKTVESGNIEVNFPLDIKQQGLYGLTVYPNPNKGSFVISGMAQGNVQIDIVNMGGQLVHSENIQPVNGQIHQQVRPNNILAAGIYMLRIKSETNNSVVKLVVD